MKWSHAAASATKHAIPTFRWDSAGKPLQELTDVRELQRRLRALGIEPATAADESTTGPASFVIVDPDGNPILIDQHV